MYMGNQNQNSMIECSNQGSTESWYLLVEIRHTPSVPKKKQVTLGFKICPKKQVTLSYLESVCACKNQLVLNMGNK